MKKWKLNWEVGRKQVIGIVALFLVLYLPMYLTSESMTMTTYYPAPYGVYNELRAATNAYLGYTGGRVGIGTSSPAAPYKLDVTGQTRLNGDSRVVGNLTLQGAGGTVVLAPQTVNIPGIGVKTFLSMDIVANTDVVFYDTGAPATQKYLYYHCQWVGYIYGFPGTTTCPLGKTAMHIGPIPNTTGGNSKDGFMGCCLVRWI